MDEKSDSYQRLETNLDHFRHEILENCLWNLAVVKGSRPEMMAFLETMDVSPEELGSILKHAAKAMLRDFVQQVVNLSESLEAAEIEDKEE